MGFLLLVPDFLLIVGGALLRRHARFPTEFWAGVERLVYYVLFPALLFRALATAPLPRLRRPRRFLAVGVGFTLGGMLLSALGRPLLRLDPPTFAACFQCGFRFNTYIALAIAEPARRRAGVALLSALLGVLVPLVNIAAVTVLAQGRGARDRRWRSRATRWSSPAPPGSAGARPGCRCRRFPCACSSTSRARRCRSGCSRSVPACASAATRCRSGSRGVVERRQAAGDAGDRAGAGAARASCRRSSVRWR